MLGSIPLVGHGKMIEPRTTKVLGSLLAAMTLSALLLMVMESEPPVPPQSDLATIRSAIAHPAKVSARKWNRIIVHASPSASDSLPQRCHFIVDPTATSDGRQVRSTILWRQQEDGYHTYVQGQDFNAQSIGICVIGDFSNQPPRPQQFDALMALVRELQQRFDIGADSVFLRSELNHDQGDNPGQAFPAGAFNAELNRATR